MHNIIFIYLKPIGTYVSKCNESYSVNVELVLRLHNVIYFLLRSYLLYGIVRIIVSAKMKENVKQIIINNYNLSC